MAERRNGRRAASVKGRKLAPAGNGKKPTDKSSRPAKGTLIIIGGSEDKRETKVILREAVRRIGSGRLVISTLASDYGEEAWELYRRIFTELGIRKIGHLGIEYRDESAKDP